MPPLFSRRLSCFYCGCRSAQANNRPIRKWRCEHCEAVNYLDEKGEITDPPADETSPDASGPSATSPVFESPDLGLTGSDDPDYSAYEREYPRFRKNLEERYPQVCDKCEPRVKARIRQTGYEAKSDHLRRMMDRSKAGRVARQARRWNWRSLLVFAGAICFWASIAGQISWDLMTALVVDESLRDPHEVQTSPSIILCVHQTLETRYLPRDCYIDLAPYAGLSLVAGILSLWYNPKLRLKVEGRGGRFLGLGEYYKVQLIVMVVRCAFWGVLRDPSASGLRRSLPPALHLFMSFLTILSVVISRRIVQYDTRPLVTWSDNTPTATPTRKTEATPRQTTGGKQAFFTPHETFQQNTPRFPFEKLATPRPAPEERAIPTPPPEVDDMDWSPSVQHNFRPGLSVRARDQRSILDGPTPFYGSLPAAPKPPAWNLRNQVSQRQKPIEQVVERNPFHRSPAQPSSSWKKNPEPSDTIFAAPKFFPMSDHVASTGLENLFDRTFTIKSPEDEDETWQPSPQKASKYRSPYSNDFQSSRLFQYLRFGLLLISIAAWAFSEYGHFSIQGNYIEVASLGSASLIAGFALLEALKQPIMNWNGMEILVYFAELVAAVHLGGNLPRGTLERHYFDKYGKLLLIFMAVQEALGLLALYRAAHRHTGSPQEPPHHPHSPMSPGGNATRGSPRSRGSLHSEFQSFTTAHSAVGPSLPGLSFSTAAGSSFSAQSPDQQYQLQSPTFEGPFKRDHSFSLNSLKANESDGSDYLDRDSDTETTMTTATNGTSNTVRNIRYGRNTTVNEAFFSPKRSELGPGIGGLSLEDKPLRRMTRSQTQRLQGDDGTCRRVLR